MRILVLLACVGIAASLECTDGDEIACTSQDRCVPLRYLCDTDNDCSDGSDEDSALCEAWKNSECEKGKVQCTTNGVTSCINIVDYCIRDAPRCQGDLDRRLCQILGERELQNLNSIRLPPNNIPGEAYNQSLLLGTELRQKVNSTLSHPACPNLSTRVAGQCLSVFYVGSSSWGEARSFCKHLGGDLLSIRDVQHYTDIVKHLNDNQITSDFWLGGRYEFDSNGWVWLDGNPMELGTPFWTLRKYETCNTRNVTVPGVAHREANNGECYFYTQAPESPPRGYCASITYDKHFFMSDEDCLSKKSPLCVL